MPTFLSGSGGILRPLVMPLISDSARISLHSAVKYSTYRLSGADRCADSGRTGRGSVWLAVRAAQRRLRGCLRLHLLKSFGQWLGSGSA